MCRSRTALSQTDDTTMELRLEPHRTVTRRTERVRPRQSMLDRAQFRAYA